MDTKTKKRKVVKSGQALIITLPADFVRSSGLKKGDTVGVTYDSILVIVKPELPKE
jgi:antitoxin component of MazEF toxin-antitoxin module